MEKEKSNFGYIPLETLNNYAHINEQKVELFEKCNLVRALNSRCMTK